MFIYEIPTIFGKLPSPLNDFQQAILDLENAKFPNIVSDVCYFGINPPSDPYEKVQYIMESEFTYLVISEHYQPVFNSLLLKYGAKKLNSLPSFNSVTVLAGSPQTIAKAAP